MFNNKDDAAQWAMDLMQKYGLPQPAENLKSYNEFKKQVAKDQEESIISVDMFNNKNQKQPVYMLDEDDGYHD